jgi:hypothetical protein
MLRKLAAEICKWVKFPEENAKVLKSFAEGGCYGFVRMGFEIEC